MKEPADSSPATVWTMAGRFEVGPNGRILPLRAIPKVPGIYRLEIGPLIYIGQSGNLSRRVNENARPTQGNIDEWAREHLIRSYGGADVHIATDPCFESEAERLKHEQREIDSARLRGCRMLNAFSLEPELEKARRLVVETGIHLPGRGRSSDKDAPDRALGSEDETQAADDRRQSGGSEPEMASEFQRGWTAALAAARRWHEAKASQNMIQARRSRFPKNLEREAEVHMRSAELIATLSPDDV